MSIFNSRGVVIKSMDIKENDKMLWIFTEKFGKITVMARGTKKSKSRLMPISLIFCFANYTLFKGKSMFSINEGEIIDSFQEFLSDLDILTYTSYLCELIDLSMTEGESNRELFREFVTAFYLIKNKVGDIETLIRTFEIKLLTLTGYGLNLDSCVKCRKKLSVSNYLSYQYYGGICNECTKDNGKIISYTAFKVLSYLSRLPLDKVYRVNLNSKIKDEIYKVLSDLILQSYGRKPKSLEILYSLKRSD
ncbi:DNA repair protein RecO [Clostridium pasteurianum]|uniref:DNA repair protein RecO n=1 Tax=Clostridium pasteurianum TaxID=1501 RepID=UPI002260B552|nr:DNA repair protein RecO [Clostridium pasteurianum]UZW16305.1 DNA repair protein RecO [Clostridium pasteurianum]